MTKREIIFRHIEANGNAMRYTDIIKFAFELTYGKGSFNNIDNRGYYSGAFHRAKSYNLDHKRTPVGHFVIMTKNGQLKKLPNGLWSVVRPLGHENKPIKNKIMTIAQQLKIKEFPFVIKDSNDKVIYYESSNGGWYKYEYDSKGNRIYFENSDGWWSKYEYGSNGKLIYCEDSFGNWWKKEYDSNGKVIYFEDSNGWWDKQEYDSNGKVIYFEDSNGYWYKQEYDSKGNEIYYESSGGYIIDNRPKEFTMDEVAKALGIDVKQLKIKK